jgi:hypothetical protein
MIRTLAKKENEPASLFTTGEENFLEGYIVMQCGMEKFKL